MVARLSVLQRSTGSSPGPSIRPSCFIREPQAPLLWDSLPSQEDCSLRCHVIGLEQMAEDYLFPPVSMLMKVLDKLRDYMGRAILVAPLWPNSPWFPLLTELQPVRRKFKNPQLSQNVRDQIVYDSSSLTHPSVPSPLQQWRGLGTSNWSLILCFHVLGFRCWFS